MKTDNLSEPNVKVIGPQLGLTGNDNEIIITIALPHRPDLQNLVCVLLTYDGKEISRQSVVCKNEEFRNFIFRFNGLATDKKNFYLFQDAEGVQISLEGGLTYEDCWFYGPAFNNESDKFILLSCNNPFHSGYKTMEQQFTMWKRLDERINGDRSIRLVIQGGDQVYHDRIEKSSLKALKGRDVSPEAHTAVVTNIIRNYQHFYGNLNYRKVMSRIPSVAMLDDHDITDGWGGRPDSFSNNGEFKPEWSRYFELTYSAFQAYQISKNPNPIYQGAASTYLDIGDNRIFLLDFRAEKNFKKKRLISPEHENIILDLIRNTDRRIFILSPVVPVRIRPDAEDGLGGFSLIAFHINKWLKHRIDNNKEAGKKSSWFTEKLFQITGAVAAYSDDIYDSLASSVNRPYLLRLVNAMKQSHEQHRNESVILSGDIHTAGLTEIFLVGSEFTIPQIVSSPIGYEPMPKLVKGVTTTESEQLLSDEVTEMTFRNVFYRSDRNFAIITPSNLHQADGIEFHYERLKRPLFFPAYCNRSI